MGYARKKAADNRGKKLIKKVYSILIEVGASIFTSYITFELAVHLLEKKEPGIAIAGLAGFAGSDALVALEKALLKIISKFADRL